MNVTVTPKNDDPIAVDDFYVTNNAASFTIPFADLLANDIDVDGDSIELVSLATTQGITLLNQTSLQQVVVLPTASFGDGATFTYKISDGDGGTDRGTVFVANNASPDAVDDAATTKVDQAVTVDVLGNDSDPENDLIVVTEATDGANGTTSVNPDSTIVYTPNTGFIGSDSFDYTIADDNGATGTATVSVSVDPANLAPVGVPDTATTTVNAPVVIDIFANDFDAEGDPFQFFGTIGADNGSIAFNGDNTITYTPDSGFVGQDDFFYLFSDGVNPVAAVAVTATVDDL